MRTLDSIVQQSSNIKACICTIEECTAIEDDDCDFDKITVLQFCMGLRNLEPWKFLVLGLFN
jgi:hypothetical protein